MEHRFANGRTLRLVVGDITKIPVDAMGNAANTMLAGGGGVDGAIHKAGGPSIMGELSGIKRQTGGCPTGQAVATTAGRLPAEIVLHAVGPIYGRNEDEEELLAGCYKSCLRLADDHAAKTMSLPSISTGVYGYPLDEAAPIAIETVAEYLRAGRGTVETVIFVLYNQATYDAYANALRTVE